MKLLVVLASGVVAGLALGLAFFGVLWFTVRRIATARRPGLWLGLAYVARLGLLAGGFVLIAAGDWRRLPAALLGVLAARTILMRIVHPPEHVVAVPHGGSG